MFRTCLHNDDVGKEVDRLRQRKDRAKEAELARDGLRQ